MWMFAALNTIEPPIVERQMTLILERNETWFEARVASIEARIGKRLGELAAHLGEHDWLDGAFSAGDLLMVTVLRRLGTARLLDDFPSLTAYIARGEARPAFQRAFEAQRAVFEAGASR